MSENANETTPETQTPAPATPPENLTQAAPETSAAPETNNASDKTEALVYPADGNADAVLAFRKSCGYPDNADGYGLPMDTEDQKSLAAFLHKCQLDPIAAKAVAGNVAEVLAEQEKIDKQAYDEAYSKATAAWGESKKENESLVNKGLTLMKFDEGKLRGISEAIGVEAALSMMMLLGKTQTDYSGVTGGNGSDDGESILGYVARKRG